MQIHEVVKTLESLLATENWKEATTELKLKVIELLKISRTALAPVHFRQLSVLARTCLGVTPHQLQVMLDYPQDQWDIHLITKPNPAYPKDGWLGNYLKFTESSEAPTIFHFWVGVSCIGAVLKRNVWYERAHDRIFPNHYIIILDQSAINRKSSACRIGRDLVVEVGTVNVISDKTTPEALLEALMHQKPKEDGKGFATDSYGLIYAEELAFFLGKQSYNEGMIIMLTDLADCPRERRYKTRTRQMIYLKEPGLSFLGASTYDWLHDAIPQSAFGGGFMSRVLYVAAEDGKVERVISRSQPDDSLRTDLVTQLADIATAKGVVRFTLAGEAWYDDFYYQQRMNQPEDKTMVGYHNRKHDHLVRLSLILAMSESKPLELTPDLMERALLLLDTLEQPMPEAFIDKNASPTGQVNMRILKQLKMAGGRMQRNLLLKKNHKYVNSRGFDDAMQTMIEARLIEALTTTAGIIYCLRE